MDLTGLSVEDLQKLSSIKVWDKKILVVDDEASIRDVFSDVLGRLGKVETASDGEDGLEKIKNSFYDAVISEFFPYRGAPSLPTPHISC